MDRENASDAAVPMTEPHLDQPLQAKYLCVVRPSNRSASAISLLASERSPRRCEQDGAVQLSIHEVRLQIDNPPVTDYRFVTPI